MASICRMESVMLLLVFILVSFCSCQLTTYNTNANQDGNYLKRYLDKRLESFRVDIHRSFQKQHRRTRREVNNVVGKHYGIFFSLTDHHGLNPIYNSSFIAKQKNKKTEKRKQTNKQRNTNKQKHSVKRKLGYMDNM